MAVREKPLPTTPDAGDSARAGFFQTNLSLYVVRELNRRGISFRLEETDPFATAVYVHKAERGET
ncbi:MAG: hypothetical protein HY887_00625, partial [Deltaproteobacteria bacterium]|nr:hypothetical protein [Deltaproteobacteria bacterium]